MGPNGVILNDICALPIENFCLTDIFFLLEFTTNH